MWLMTDIHEYCMLAILIVDKNASWFIVSVHCARDLQCAVLFICCTTPPPTSAAPETLNDNNKRKLSSCNPKLACTNTDLG